eukprot:gene17531-6352_t
MSLDHGCDALQREHTDLANEIACLTYQIAAMQLRETAAFADWLDSLHWIKHKILVPGNHDLTADKPFYDHNWQDWHGAQLKSAWQKIPNAVDAVCQRILRRERGCAVNPAIIVDVVTPAAAASPHATAVPLL